MNAPLVSIVMRSFNEGWALRDTLSMLKRQEYPNWELIVIDSGSTDGSQDLIRAAQPQHFVQIQPHEYNPSRVMNQGMRLARAEICIFLNADATPVNNGWLQPLVDGLRDPRVAACFGRQIPRPDCLPAFAAEYDRCFGPKRQAAKWDHFFSMVSSGIRKEIWCQRGFREDLQYAEDDEYTRWCKSKGYAVLYIPESIVMHSHNYTPDQVWKRAFGDARAIGRAWAGNPKSYSWIRTVAAGVLRDIARDSAFLVRSGQARALLQVARCRWTQRKARLAGFRKGWAETHTNAGVLA